MKKILFYCQHLLGIGHVTRSLSLVNALSQEFSVTYVQGGPPVPLEPAPAVRKVQLAPLLMRESDGTLYDPSGASSLEEIFALRRSKLRELALEGYDAVLVELYPFGRKKFASEVHDLLAELKGRNPRCKVLCSVRDILVEKGDARERNQKIAAIVNRDFDLVLVHSDSQLIRLEETFSEEKQIAEKIRYTGFVAEPPRPERPSREKRILFSLGGGSVGEELFDAGAAVVPLFPEYRFQFVLGPYSSPALRSRLEAALLPYRERAEISGLLPDFEVVLGKSALSLSMAGYNTVMNLLNTRTPALVLSYEANHEQRMRASLLEKRGYLTLLGASDLQAERLAQKMRERLGLPYPSSVPDLSGSLRTLEALREIL